MFPTVNMLFQGFSEGTQTGRISALSAGLSYFPATQAAALSAEIRVVLGYGTVLVASAGNAQPRQIAAAPILAKCGAAIAFRAPIPLAYAAARNVIAQLALLIFPQPISVVGNSALVLDTSPGSGTGSRSEQLLIGVHVGGHRLDYEAGLAGHPTGLELHLLEPNDRVPHWVGTVVDFANPARAVMWQKLDQDHIALGHNARTGWIPLELAVLSAVQLQQVVGVIHERLREQIPHRLVA